MKEKKGVAVGAKHLSGTEETGSGRWGQRPAPYSKTDICCTVTEEKMGSQFKHPILKPNNVNEGNTNVEHSRESLGLCGAGEKMCFLWIKIQDFKECSLSMGQPFINVGLHTVLQDWWYIPFGLSKPLLPSTSPNNRKEDRRQKLYIRIFTNSFMMVVEIPTAIFCAALLSSS